MFGISSTAIKNMGPSELEVGQIWEYRDLLSNDWCKIPKNAVSYPDIVNAVDFAIEVLDIHTVGGMMGFPAGRLVEVEFLKSASSSIIAGTTLEFAAGDFVDDGFFRLIFDPGVDNGKRYGVYCGICGRYNEYALFVSDFMCWGCKNGW